MIMNIWQPQACPMAGSCGGAGTARQAGGQHTSPHDGSALNAIGCIHPQIAVRVINMGEAVAMVVSEPPARLVRCILRVLRTLQAAVHQPCLDHALEMLQVCACWCTAAWTVRTAWHGCFLSVPNLARLVPRFPSLFTRTRQSCSLNYNRQISHMRIFTAMGSMGRVETCKPNTTAEIAAPWRDVQQQEYGRSSQSCLYCPVSARGWVQVAIHSSRSQLYLDVTNWALHGGVSEGGLGGAFNHMPEHCKTGWPSVKAYTKWMGPAECCSLQMQGLLCIKAEIIRPH